MQASVTATAQFGRYRILRELGRGAMGVVHLAEDPVLGRKLAIKTITLPADARERAEYEARFMQEAKAAGALNHPNIITVHDVGRENDVAFMALEFLEGVELGKLMAQRRLPVPILLDFGAQVAEGLAFAHQAGVIHRDIKPANIMIVRGTQVKIMDFGIARMRQSQVKTQTGMMLGSPRYMSPEQVNGDNIDPRSDIFTLGVLLYEMASGLPPFDGADFFQLVYNIAGTPHKPLNRVIPGLPDQLTAIVDRALQKDPVARYQGAGDLARDLRALKAVIEQAETTGTPLPAASPPVTISATLQTQRVPAKPSLVATERIQRRLSTGDHYELPHEREFRLALEAQTIPDEDADTNESRPLSLKTLAIAATASLVLAIVLGEIALFQRTTFGDGDLSAAQLFRFAGLASALLIAGWIALKWAERMKAAAGTQQRVAQVLPPLAALIISTLGYRVALIVAAPLLSSRARTQFDWCFVLAIAASALWLAYTLIRQSDGLGQSIKRRMRPAPKTNTTTRGRTTARTVQSKGKPPVKRS